MSINVIWEIKYVLIIRVHGKATVQEKTSFSMLNITFHRVCNNVPSTVRITDQ